MFSGPLFGADQVHRLSELPGGAFRCRCCATVEPVQGAALTENVDPQEWFRSVMARGGWAVGYCLECDFTTVRDLVAFSVPTPASGPVEVVE